MAKPLSLLALPEIAQILSLQELLVVTGTVNALSSFSNTCWEPAFKFTS
jgi:hypothetical protein